MVVLYHLQIPHFENGFLGVDIFFVISGFLMAKLYTNGTWMDFYRRRLNRLYPAYLLTLFTTLIIGAFSTIPVDFRQLVDQTLAGVFFFSNLFYWNQNSYFDKAAFNPLLNLWSLAVEVQFYLLVPFLYPVLRKHKWLFIAVFSASLFGCFIIQTISPKTSFFLMPLRIWEFLIGAWVAWWTTPNSKLFRAGSPNAPLIYLALLLACIFTFNLKPDAVGTYLAGHPALPALLVCALTGLILKSEINHRFMASPLGSAISRVGDYSYSIYLVHFPIIVLFNYVPFGGTRLQPDSLTSLTVVLASVVIASIASYRYAERGSAKRLNTRTFRIAAILVVVACALVLSHVNWSRYSLQEQNIFGAWEDRDTYRCGKAFRIVHPTEALCSIAEGNGDRKILLLGNSHADSIKGAFSNKAAEYGVSTYFAVSNEPLMTGGPKAELFVAESLKRNITAIVLHYSNIYRSKSATAELEKLIALAKSNGIKVVLIAPVPTYDVHIPKAMFERMGSYDSFRVNRTQHSERTQGFRAMMQRIEPMGVAVYDPAELLCQSNGECRFATPDQKPYYFDAGHLTLSGAQLLKPLFDEILRSL